MIAVALALGLALGADDQPFSADKALHFSASFAIAGGAYAGAALVKLPVEGRLTAGVAFGLLAGVAKELLDTQAHGDVSALDLVWDVIGTGVGTLLAWLVDRLLFARTAGPLTLALSPLGGERGLGVRGWRGNPAR